MVLKGTGTLRNEMRLSWSRGVLLDQLAGKDYCGGTGHIIEKFV